MTSLYSTTRASGKWRCGDTMFTGDLGHVETSSTDYSHHKRQQLAGQRGRQAANPAIWFTWRPSSFARQSVARRSPLQWVRRDVRSPGLEPFRPFCFLALRRPLFSRTPLLLQRLVTGTNQNRIIFQLSLLNLALRMHKTLHSCIMLFLFLLLALFNAWPPHAMELYRSRSASPRMFLGSTPSSTTWKVHHSTS